MSKDMAVEVQVFPRVELRSAGGAGSVLSAEAMDGELVSVDGASAAFCKSIPTSDFVAWCRRCVEVFGGGK